MSESPKRFANSRALLVLITLLLLLPVAGGTLARAFAGADDEDSFYREYSVFTEVFEYIRDHYVEETSLDRLFAGAFDGTADALDPLATYVPASDVERYRQVLDLGGGRSGLQVVRERGILYVVGVAPDSPGAEAGLKSGDILSKLDSRSTRLMPLWQAQVMLAAEPDATLPIQVLRQGQTLELELTMVEFPAPDPVVEARDGVRLVRIPQFGPTLVEQLEKLLQSPDLAGRESIILDVRSVAGGDAGSALAAADLFVEGQLGELRERDRVVEEYISQREPVWRGRLVLLTNRGSQGASELFAAILRQRAGAQLVGAGTFGHAGRRASKTLSNGAELYYTDAFYVAPDGTSLSEALMPDLRVNGSSRSLSEVDLSLEELVIERAIGLVREQEAAERKAA